MADIDDEDDNTQTDDPLAYIQPGIKPADPSDLPSAVNGLAGGSGIDINAQLAKAQAANDLMNQLVNSYNSQTGSLQTKMGDLINNQQPLQPSQATNAANLLNNILIGNTAAPPGKYATAGGILLHALPDTSGSVAALKGNQADLNAWEANREAQAKAKQQEAIEWFKQQVQNQKDQLQAGLTSAKNQADSANNLANFGVQQQRWQNQKDWHDQELQHQKDRDTVNDAATEAAATQAQANADRQFTLSQQTQKDAENNAKFAQDWQAAHDPLKIPTDSDVKKQGLAFFNDNYKPDLSIAANNSGLQTSLGNLTNSALSSARNGATSIEDQNAGAALQKVNAALGSDQRYSGLLQQLNSGDPVKTAQAANTIAQKADISTKAINQMNASGISPAQYAKVIDDTTANYGKDGNGVQSLNLPDNRSVGTELGDFVRRNTPEILGGAPAYQTPKAAPSQISDSVGAINNPNFKANSIDGLDANTVSSKLQSALSARRFNDDEISHALPMYKQYLSDIKENPTPQNLDYFISNFHDGLEGYKGASVLQQNGITQ